MPLSADALVEDQTFIYLSRRIFAGECALFLGAGASISSGAPTSQELADLICRQVLMTEDHYPLAEAVAYADALPGRRKVVQVIDERLRDLTPSPAMRALTAFPWKSIFTTNFDDLIERAYTDTPATRAAEIDLIDPDRGLDRPSSGRIPLHMIHGSIKRPLDQQMGLVLTPDDVRRAVAYRQALYRRLVDELQDSEVVYVGFSLSDTDFQEVIAEVWDAASGQSALVPRGYGLLPNVRSFAQKHWDTKKISLIDTRA